MNRFSNIKFPKKPKHPEDDYVPKRSNAPTGNLIDNLKPLAEVVEEYEPMDQREYDLPFNHKYHMQTLRGAEGEKEKYCMECKVYLKGPMKAPLY